VQPVWSRDQQIITGSSIVSELSNRLDCGSELTATPLSGMQIFQLKSPEKCQESAWFNGIFPGKDLGNTRLGNPESSSQILLRVATHRFREVP
jgi:hypothetical protein